MKSCMRATFGPIAAPMLAGDDKMVARSMMPVLLELKGQIGEWRRALIGLTHSQSGVWRRPKF